MTDNSLECDECKSGVHAHMGAMYRDDYLSLKDTDKVEILDCKNLTTLGQCVCHLWQEEHKKLMGAF